MKCSEGANNQGKSETEAPSPDLDRAAATIRHPSQSNRSD